MSDPSWRVALNPPIYLVSVLPGLGVPAIASQSLQHPIGLLLATIAVVLLQHAINLFNDAADWRLGADVEKFDSWVRVHGERPGLATWHGVISLLAGGFLGLGVLIVQQQFQVLYAAVPLVVLGYLYNAGPRPLSYTHLGEWVTGVCYGPGVFGCLWWVAGLPAGSAVVFGSVAFAALAMSLLLSHQPPQIDTDRAAGKRSFAVRFGKVSTVRAARLLFVVFLSCLAVPQLMSLSLLPAGMLLLLGVLLAYRVYSTVVNPKRILVAASLFTLVSLGFASAFAA